MKDSWRAVSPPNLPTEDAAFVPMGKYEYEYN
jgi:hypothetical protein